MEEKTQLNPPEYVCQILDVIEYLRKTKKWQTTQDVCDSLRLKNRWAASKYLKKLFNHNLVERKQDENATQNQYKYRIKISTKS